MKPAFTLGTNEGAKEKASPLAGSFDQPN